MATSFTREQLEAKTDKELKRMCSHELNMPGYSKKLKSEVVDAILAKYGSGSTGTISKGAPTSQLSGIQFSGQSTLTKPSAAFGNRSTTTIQVSCGASSGAFPVVGRKVKEVGEFLREVLNVDRLSTGLVNGKEVSGDYELKQGDNLEFLKPAGKKGC